MDTSSLLVGKGGGLFGVCQGGVWHGAFDPITRPTRAGRRTNIQSLGGRLRSDFQVQGHVHERHPRPCGLLEFLLNSAFSNTQQFWAPGNFELVVLAHSDERSE
jgi:hypothetical protein